MGVWRLAHLNPDLRPEFTNMVTSSITHTPPIQIDRRHCGRNPTLLSAMLHADFWKWTSPTSDREKERQGKRTRGGQFKHKQHRPGFKSQPQYLPTLTHLHSPSRVFILSLARWAVGVFSGGGLIINNDLFTELKPESWCQKQAYRSCRTQATHPGAQQPTGDPETPSYVSP